MWFISGAGASVQQHLLSAFFTSGGLLQIFCIYLPSHCRWSSTVFPFVPVPAPPWCCWPFLPLVCPPGTSDSAGHTGQSSSHPVVTSPSCPLLPHADQLTSPLLSWFLLTDGERARRASTWGQRKCEKRKDVMSHGGVCPPQCVRTIGNGMKNVAFLLYLASCL